MARLRGIDNFNQLDIQMKTGITAERLRELLSYDPETGAFTWLVKRPGRWNKSPGTAAGSFDTKGYLLITLDSQRFSAHRLAFLYMTGEWPKKCIDHIDGDSANNRFKNLRDVDQSTNMQNLQASKALTNRSTPFLGVRRADSIKNPWAATIKVCGKFKHLGVFKTPELAHAAYLSAKRIYHPGNTL